jgi:hypothetical protein
MRKIDDARLIQIAWPAGLAVNERDTNPLNHGFGAGGRRLSCAVVAAQAACRCFPQQASPKGKSIRKYSSKSAV